MSSTMLNPDNCSMWNLHEKLSSSACYAVVFDCEKYTIPKFGGRYVPEALFERVESLASAFEEIRNDATFLDEFQSYYTLIGGPSRLHLARGLTDVLRGPRIWLKREDLKFTGSHNITNALGQALFARRLGMKRIIAETGSGSHGVATAAICQMLGLECVIYMGVNDARKHTAQKERMQDFGARVVEVIDGSGTLREAANETLRAMVSAGEDVYHLLGGPNGPEPLPLIANSFQMFAGVETRTALLKTIGRLPDAVIACAGAHGSAVGIFSPFLYDKKVELIAVEGAGRGLESEHHAAVLTCGSDGVFRGARTLLLQDGNGQILPATSIASDFGDPCASPQLAEWVTLGRVTACAVTDTEALSGQTLLRLTENIDCSVEDGHAIAAVLDIAPTMPVDSDIVICIGNGSRRYDDKLAELDFL